MHVVENIMLILLNIIISNTKYNTCNIYINLINDKILLEINEYVLQLYKIVFNYNYTIIQNCIRTYLSRRQSFATENGVIINDMAFQNIYPNHIYYFIIIYE